MDALGIVESENWSLAPLVGFEHPLLTINMHTIVYTWIVIAFLFIILLPVRIILSRNFPLLRTTILAYTQAFIDTTTQAFNGFYANHTIFIASLFTFILVCNIASLVPWMEEPTTDLNTTFALGLISFFYIQATAIYTHGLIRYLKGFFQPFIFMFPLNVIGKLASIISISFRLFGNIYGGAIISRIYYMNIEGSLITETFGLLSGINFLIMLFFGMFEGALQAFVFSMLTLTYLSMSIQGEGGH